MLKVTSATLELRGVASKQSAKGNMYYYLNVEDEEGTPYSLFCPKMEVLPEGLKKGELIVATFDVRVFQGNERLVVSHVKRAV